MTELTSTMQDIKTKQVCIVKFGPLSNTDGLRPAEYYQVTIDPGKLSANGKFIRFGTNNGDEIVGWQKCSAITIVDVLGEWDGDEPPVMLYGTGLTMLVADK
jgi:hypothetical protein